MDGFEEVIRSRNKGQNDYDQLYDNSTAGFKPKSNGPESRSGTSKDFRARLFAKILVR